MNDPYIGMIDLFKKTISDEPTCKLVVGIVKNASPLIINAAGLENEQDDIVFVSEVPELSAEDSVLLLTADYQKFYLIGRILTDGDYLPLPANGEIS